MSAALELLLQLSVFPLTILALTALLNSFSFPRLQRRANPPLTTPLISILIPMRNESAVIAETVTGLLKQDYPNFELLLLDDASSDDSARTALRAANGDSRLKVLTGAALPTGWLGKTWACHQLSQQARGEYLLFSDADVNWQPGALSALAREALSTRADLLTVWPQQITVSLGERLIVPLMGFSIRAYLPALAVHYIPWRVFAAAIGQCLLFRRPAYDKIGGHQAIPARITDDMSFAYAIKGRGLRFRMADSAGLLTCRMYRSWDEVRNGYAKNILAGHGNSLAFLAFSTFFHYWVFVLPWAWALFHAGRGLLPALTLAALGVIIRALTAAQTRQRLTDALWMPLSVLGMTIIVFQALKWHFAGGPQWKGRTLNATPKHNKPAP